jgi:hypothetical protein
MALGTLAGLIVLTVMTLVAGLAVLAVPGRWSRAFQLRYALLEFDVLERADIAIEQPRDGVTLGRCQVPRGNGSHDIRKRREHARRAVKRRQLQGNHRSRRRGATPVEAKADRRRVAPLGRLDGGANDVLGLALEQLLGEDPCRARLSAGRRDFRFAQVERSWVSPCCEERGPPARGLGAPPRAIAP